MCNIPLLTFLTVFAKITVSQIPTGPSRRLFLWISYILPKTILTNGGMKTTVAGSVLEKAGTMENLLDRIPNLSAQNGSIKVFGRGEPMIYINGKQMRDKSELDRLRSDIIKSVEVITNPGASYPASAKAVICITTKKTPGEGLGIDATAMGEYDEKDNLGANGRVNVNYRRNGLELGHTPLSLSNISQTTRTCNKSLILTRPGTRKAR